MGHGVVLGRRYRGRRFWGVGLVVLGPDSGGHQSIASDCLVTRCD